MLAAADHSAWNGRVVESTGAMLGLAHWDGTLYLDREAIIDPLHHLYAHAGETQSAATLIRYRESLATLLHEHAHFLGPTNATQEAAREAFVKPGSRQLEEGVTEAWAQDHLDAYIRHLGIDKAAPGITSIQAPGYYAAFVPAVRTLTTDLESRNNLAPGELLALLNRQTAAGQLPLLVALTYNSTRLPDLEPPDTPTRSRLESILRSGLAHLDNFEFAPPEAATASSLTTAHQLLDHLHQEIQSAESAYTFSPHLPAIPPPTHTAPAALPSPTHTALPSPTHVAAPSPTHADAPSPTHTAVPSPTHTALSGVAPPTHRPTPPSPTTPPPRAAVSHHPSTGTRPKRPTPNHLQPN
ncbi:hypothetical protein GCM10009804_71070 [Kribbella hippodromi]|uniref:Uncharacterized protein n=1 Tax=Kribbella hippodromi TaxID=434347 RepID=A0ABN2EDS1_9ACTN